MRSLCLPQSLRTIDGWRTWSPPPGHITEVLYAWVWMPLVALTSVSPLAPYSKRQTEGHFVERLRTGFVIQHGPERACDWSRASTIAPSYTCANPTRRSALRSAEHAFEVTLGLLGGGGFGNTEGVWGPLPVSMVRSRSPGVDEYGRASPHGTTA